MNRSFYRQTLPQPPAIAFSSRTGREIFTRSLRHGYMERFFPLCEQFCTQEEPSFCGLSTLTMVLNAMGQDPGRIWKGPWRYYHENMLTGCVPLSAVKAEGITFRQLECLARCNDSSVQSYTPTEPNVTVGFFREMVKKSTAEGNDFLIVSYGRSYFGQTGNGHFSPIGGYDPVEDLVLILDVARFKYPPHWVKLDMLYAAMKLIDPTTKRARGFMVLTKRNQGRSIYFFISQRTKSWKEFVANVRKTLVPLSSSISRPCNSHEIENSAEAVVTCVAKRFSKDVVDMFSTYINAFGINRLDYVSAEHQKQVDLLLMQLRTSPAYHVVSKCKDLLPPGDIPALEVMTILLLSLPESTWHDERGKVSPCAQCFVLTPMSNPLNNEILSIRYQLEALFQYCKNDHC